ncbi:MAG TPA: hypothetical protein VMA73_29330 [Streptosporangiaceae bacterium]|nr:hypothetical protein [Streptosporangiaceae bacterium]
MSAASGRPVCRGHAERDSGGDDADGPIQECRQHCQHVAVASQRFDRTELARPKPLKAETIAGKFLDHGSASQKRGLLWPNVTIAAPARST